MAASANRQRPKASIVKQETVGHAISFLEELPEKRKEELSLREAVDQMQDQIRAALAKGYNYNDIAKMLSDKGIKISALTLKNYAPSGRRQASKAKARRPRKSSSNAAAPLDEVSLEGISTSPRSSQASEPEVKAEPSPTRPRRGRTKSVAADTKTESRTSTRSLRRGKSSAKAEAPEPVSKKRRKSKSAD